MFQLKQFNKEIHNFFTVWAKEFSIKIIELESYNPANYTLAKPLCK